MVSDHGATRDLAASLTEGLRLHLADVAARMPGAEVILQLDEPSLPAVLGGRVGTPSGWGTVRSVADHIAEQTLGDVLAVAGTGRRIVHCCAADAPIALLRRAGADAVALAGRFAGHRRNAGRDRRGGRSRGVALLGVVPSTDSRISAAEVVQQVEHLWNQLGFERDRLASSIVPTPVVRPRRQPARLTPDGP